MRLRTLVVLTLTAFSASAAAQEPGSSPPAEAAAPEQTAPAAPEGDAAPAEQAGTPVEPSDPIPSAEPAGEDKPPLSTYDRLRQENNEPIEEERTLTGQLIRTVFALGIVVGLIYLIFKLGLGRLLQGGGIPGLSSSSNREVRVVERTAIDGKNALYLVELGGERRILVGGGDHGVTYLCEAGAAEKPRAFSDVLQDQVEGETDDA
ncbi:MAG: flagellar biosynthetic protein FliO [Myxococcota bacterium]